MTLEIVKDIGQSWDSQNCAAHGVGLDWELLFYYTFPGPIPYPITTTASRGFENIVGKSQP